MHRRNSASFRLHIQNRAVVVVEGATVIPLQHGATTMLALGLLLNTVGLGVICWLMFTLAIYVLLFSWRSMLAFGPTIVAPVCSARRLLPSLLAA